MINQYKIISKIGTGAFGKVYQVENTRTKKIFAMKKFKKS